MRRGLVMMILVSAVTLAAVAGARMSTEAIAVVVGVICGAAAGIPVSLLILVLTSRQSREIDDQARRPVGQSAYPPVVVIQGGTPLQERLPSPTFPPAATAFQPSGRQFHLVGDYDIEGGAP